MYANSAFRWPHKQSNSVHAFCQLHYTHYKLDPSNLDRFVLPNADYVREIPKVNLTAVVITKRKTA